MSEGQKPQSTGLICFACKKEITNNTYSLKAINHNWHKECFACKRCHQRLFSFSKFWEDNGALFLITKHIISFRFGSLMDNRNSFRINSLFYRLARLSSMSFQRNTALSCVVLSRLWGISSYVLLQTTYSSIDLCHSCSWNNVK
jgi:hypothetical protein